MNPGNWRWLVSSLFYRFSYIDLVHQIDEDLFAYLGHRTQGAIVADCGCGPGVVTEKFLQRGALRVLAIDASASMLRQTYSCLPDAIATGRVVIVQDTFKVSLFTNLRNRFLNDGGIDIILFKRSLYLKPEQALSILQAAVASLSQGGVLVLIHGERSLRRYAFGPELQVMSYTPFHIFNRGISKLGEKLGFGEYTLYEQAELVDLLSLAATGRLVELIPSQQQAYNLVAILN
jgi:SAM-dependent methyltransferase